MKTTITTTLLLLLLAQHSITTTAFFFPMTTARRSLVTPPVAAAASAPTTTATTASRPTIHHATNNNDDDDEQLEDTRPPPVRPPPTPIQYNSPLFPPKVIDALWNEQRKPLLRLGMKGVQSSHLNSLRELLDAHNVVRVKVNGPPTINLQAMAERTMAAGTATDASTPMGVLLRVKGKEFLVGRTDKMEALRKKLLLGGSGGGGEQ